MVQRYFTEKEIHEKFILVQYWSNIDKQKKNFLYCATYINVNYQHERKLSLLVSPVNWITHTDSSVSH